MLDKNTKLFFKKAVSLCDNGKCLTSIEKMENMSGLDKKRVQNCFKSLENEDYIDVIYTDKHGIPFVFFTLKKKGIEFSLYKKRTKKEIIERVCLAFLSAFATFIFGRLIRYFFS